MKYIDAEKLKAEIERLYEGEAPSHDQQCEFEDGYFTGIATISKFIDSLQQEQPEVDLEEAFDTVAFQKGVAEGRRLEREDAL